MNSTEVAPAPSVDVIVKMPSALRTMLPCNFAPGPLTATLFALTLCPAGQQSQLSMYQLLGEEPATYDSTGWITRLSGEPCGGCRPIHQYKMLLAVVAGGVGTVYDAVNFAMSFEC